MLKDKNKNIINQVKGKSYNSQQTLIQKIKHNLSNSVRGTFKNFVSNEKQIEIVKNLLKDFIKEYNNNYEDYYMDIQRYNITYNIIIGISIIIGFGYSNIRNDKVSIIIDNYPLYKFSQYRDFKFNGNSRNNKEVLSRKLLRHYLEGNKIIFKVMFPNYSEYSSYYSSILNVDIISAFLAECNLNTIGWIEMEHWELNSKEKYTTFDEEYIVQYKNIKSVEINSYPSPSILSFDIECMSHDFESFPNRYIFEDYISTISLVFNHENEKKCIAICVKFDDDINVINKNEFEEIDAKFFPFLDLQSFKAACIEQSIFKIDMKKYEAQKFNKENKNNIANKVEDIKDKVEENTEDNVEIDVENNIESKVECNVESNVESNVKNNEEKLVEDNVEDNAENKDKNNVENDSSDETLNFRNKNLIIQTNKNICNPNQSNNTYNSEVNERFNKFKNILIKKRSYDEGIVNRFNRLSNILNVNYSDDGHSRIDKKFDPDIIIGFNTFGFDYKYLAQRAGMYLSIDTKETPFSASRILNKPSQFNNLMGDEVELYIPGRIAVDIYKYAKSLNLPSSNLNYVSEQLLNKHKIDLPYKEMFYLIYENTEESLHKVAKYCVMDSILTLNIFNVSHQWIQLLEVAKISRIRIDEVYKTGQSKKFSNLLYKYSYDNNICIDLDQSNIQGYKGATVIEPKPGVYDYCTMLDFTSLYPSVIITHNICYTTLLDSSTIDKYPKDSYHRIDIGDKVYYYTKNHIGILPQMMKVLLSERVRYKNLMKESSGADYIIYDKRQYALKIQANSIYGCLGSSSLKFLRFLPGAECTTGMGRNYLNKAINIIQEKTKFHVIYGDTDSCLIEYKKEKKSFFEMYYSQNKNSNKINNNENNNNNNNNIINDNENVQNNNLDHFDTDKFVKECKEVSNIVTNLLPEGMHLKYENTFSRMLIISKKKYSGILADKDKPTLYIKGIDLIKKNTCIFIRDYYKIFLYMILYKYPKKLIKEKVIKMKKELLAGEVPFEKLIMRLSIGPKYKNKSYYVLLFINNHKRYNLDYKVGEKINYVIIKTTNFSFSKDSNLFGDKIMSLDLYNNLKEKSLKDKNIIVPKLDYNYYYNHYVRKGLINLLKSYSEEISELL
ncbi:DNA/RNA polymerase [Neocallimastix lanati (nom. inval.)]|nr:DNA/RNA polymerase [Neocallimastix sp. JGI-2020a]